MTSFNRLMPTQCIITEKNVLTRLDNVCFSRSELILSKPGLVCQVECSNRVLAFR